LEIKVIIRLTKRSGKLVQLVQLVPFDQLELPIVQSDTLNIV